MFYNLIALSTTTMDRSSVREKTKELKSKVKEQAKEISSLKSEYTLKLNVLIPQLKIHFY